MKTEKIEKIAIDFKRLEKTLGELKTIRISLDIGGASWRKIQKLNDDQESFCETFEYQLLRLGVLFKRQNNLTSFISKSIKNFFLPNQGFRILTYLSNVDVERNDGYKIFH